MAIELNVKELVVPVKFIKEGSEDVLVVDFNATDENIKRLTDPNAYKEIEEIIAKNEKVLDKGEILHEDGEVLSHEINEAYDSAYNTISSMYNFVFGYDVFDDIYEHVGSIAKCVDYLYVIVEQLPGSLKDLGLDVSDNPNLKQFAEEQKSAVKNNGKVKYIKK